MTELYRPTSLTAVRHSTYGSRPWCIRDQDGQIVEGPPQPFNHPDLGPMTVSGARYFQRKKDAQAVIDAYWAALRRVESGHDDDPRTTP